MLVTMGKLLTKLTHKPLIWHDHDYNIVYYFNTTQTVKLMVEYYFSHLETVIERNNCFTQPDLIDLSDQIS